MLLYDWKKIFECAEGNPSDCVLIFKMMVKGLIPRNKYDPIYKYYTKDFKGSSFLAHPDVLLFHSYKYSNTEIAQYLALASIRSVGEYYASGCVTVDLLHISMDRSLFDDNRLLTIDEDEILHFLYEEVPQEKH